MERSKIKKYQTTQTSQSKVFMIHREMSLFTHSRVFRNIGNQKIVQTSEIRVEEFILDNIGRKGIHGNNKRFGNTYLRNIMMSPNLFLIRKGKLVCLFEQRLKWIAIYLHQSSFYIIFMRMFGNMYRHRSRFAFLTIIYNLRRS